MSAPLNYIDGNWVTPDLALPAQLCDANSGEILAAQRGSSNRQVQQALAAAEQAHQQGEWRDLPAPLQADKLEQVATALEARADTLAHADAQQTGVVISLTEKLALVCAG